MSPFHVTLLRFVVQNHTYTKIMPEEKIVNNEMSTIYSGDIHNLIPSDDHTTLQLVYTFQVST